MRGRTAERQIIYGLDAKPHRMSVSHIHVGADGRVYGKVRLQGMVPVVRISRGAKWQRADAMKPGVRP